MRILLLFITISICDIVKADNFFFSPRIGDNSTTGSIYYISPTGSNAAAGTIAAPWKTLVYACNNATTAGDIIHILPGTYTETATCNLRVGVSIEGEGETSHIVSTYASGAAISLYSNTDGTNGNQSLSFFKLSGSNLTAKQGIMVQSRSNVKVFNLTIQDFRGDGILFKGAISGGQPTIYATGNELYNCNISNCSDRAEGQGSIVATGYRGMLIHDNILTQTSRPIGHNGNSYSASAEGWSEGLKFYRNKSYRLAVDEADWSFHCEMWNSQGGMEFYENEFYNGKQMIDLAGEENGSGIIKGTYPYAAYIHDNLFQMDTPVTEATSSYLEKAVTIEGNIDGVIVSNNHFKNMPYGIEITVQNSDRFMNDITIQNNLFENGGYVNPGGWGFDIDILTSNDLTHNPPCENIRIYNNTFSSTRSHSALFVYMNPQTIVRNVEFINNIVKGVRDYGYITFFENAGTKTNFTIKNNLLYQNTNNNAISLQVGATLPTASVITGNIIANPLLDVAFVPQVGSPAINAGVNVGLPFCQTAPDIGWNEYCPSSTAPVANAGVDQTITLPVSNVTLSGTATTSGTISSWVWRKLTGGAATIGTPNAQTTTASGLVQGVYTFELKVTDNSGATDTDTMQVTVNPAVNQLPTANAGLDQNITLPVNSVSLNGSGTDPDGSISAYLWTKISGPTGGTITNATSATTSVTALTQGVYRYQLRVTDNSGATDTDTMQVTVNPAVNQLPTANAGLDQNITLPVNSVSLNGSGTDPDGSISAYLWTKISGPTGGTITNATSATTSVTALTQGVYRYQLRVTDNSGATDTDTMQVTVNPAVNQLPTANAGLDQNITLPVNSVSLNGSGTDPDGSISAYLWTKISGPTGGTITNATSATTSVTALIQGVYRYQLRVTDNSGATDTDTMQVTVNPAVNQLPTANAGLDQNITLPVNSVSLNGSGTDPDGSISAYLWTKISGPTGGTITNAASATTSVTALIQGVYRYQLRVTDNSGATDTDTMQVTVNPAVNQLPTANAGLDQNITLPVNSVSLNGSGTDPDGTISAYLWTKISGPTGGTITNSASASTSVTALIQGVYKYQLRVTDNSGATDTDTMQVTVNPAPNQAPTAEAGLNQTITLPVNTVTLSGNGTDPDGTITSYSWVKISGPTSGTITNNTAATTTVTGLLQGVYLFQLTVTDNNGATDTDIMQVNVNAALPPPNQLPTANAGLDQNITLPVNMVSLNGSGNDPDGIISAYRWRKISGPTTFSITNTIIAATTVTGLVQGVYKFELRVTDDSGANGFDTMQVTVNQAINQLPTANAGLDQSIILPVNSVSLNGSGTDQDGNISAYLWTKISGPVTGTISNANSAVTSVTGLVEGVYKFELKVTDNRGGTDTDSMLVIVNPAPNQGPTAEAGLNQSITLPVNTIALSGSGTDPDGTISAYSWVKLSGPTSGTITNPNDNTTTVTGLVQGVYQFELTVTDNEGATDTDIMQVNVNAAIPPPNQAPIANAGVDQIITLPVNSVSLEGVGTDPDGTISAYRWRKISGPTTFTITNTTAARTTVTGLVEGIYQFELRVTDNSGANSFDTMQVTVNPAINQLPTANAGLDQNIILPVNTVSLSGSGTDPDGIISSYLWTKISGPTSGTITNATSATTSVTDLVQGIYIYQLRVTDNNGAADTDTMQVTVNPAPNQAPAAEAGLNQTITLPVNTVTLSGSGTDPDGTIASYSWIKLSGPTSGTITNAGSATTTVTGLVQGVYQFELIVTDNNGATDTDIMQVNVNAALPPANQAPVANAGLDQNITLPVNQVSLNGSGNDPDGTISAFRWRKISGPATFTITSSTTTATTVTGLVEGVYQFEFRVTDNNGATGFDTMLVTVNQALNQAPTANTGLDQSITLPVNSVSLSGSGTDPDGTISAYLWTKISGPVTGTISSTTSAITLATDLVQGIYIYQLRVTDNNGATDTDTIQVTVNPALNQDPIANAGIDTSIYLPTNSLTLSGNGIDPDGNIVSYNWNVISGTSYLLTNSNSTMPTLAELQQGIYQVELTVTDNNGTIGRDTVTITVGAGRLQNLIDDVTIMGNPVQNTLKARITSSSVNRLMKIVLYSINGVLLYDKSLRLNQNVQLHEIDMSRYSKGTYILQVYFDKVIPVVKKVIKM